MKYLKIFRTKNGRERKPKEIYKHVYKQKLTRAPTDTKESTDNTVKWD